jgi:hypothetical protein
MIVARKGSKENSIVTAMKQRKMDWGVCVIDEVH